MPSKYIPKPIGGTIERICKICGQSFTIYVVRTMDARRIYCSEECQKIGGQGNGAVKKIDCKWCGIEFLYRESTRPNARQRQFCSLTCAGKYNAKQRGLKAPRLEPRPCTVCGTLFSPRKKHNVRIYCSEECRKKLYETESTCEYCGKIFKYLGRLYSKYPNVIRRFCNKECQKAAALKAQQEKLKELGDIRCVWCYKQIPFKGNITERAIRKYCTKKCCSNHQKFKNLRYCKWCGKRFSISRTTNAGRRRKAMPGSDIFCSNDCYIMSIDKNREGYRQLKTKICPHCSETFSYHDNYAQSQRVYCSPLCRIAATFKRRNGSHE